MGIHPAAGLMSLTSGSGGSSSGALALEIGECDVEQGIEALMTLLCKSYGIVGFDLTRKAGAKNNEDTDDSDEAVIARIRGQSAARFFGFPDVSAAAGETEGLESHRFQRDVAGEDHQVGPGDPAAVFLLDRPEQTA